jgi:nicotinamidase-related amidase
MSRALLVIDEQNEYFTGALPITHPAGHLDRILRVMDAASGRIPTVVVQHHSEGLPIFRKGSPEWELHPEVAARPRDLLIQKSLPGSFTNTPLEQWLRERGISTVSIAGYMTHMCCDTTARQAVHRGFRSEFLSDATGTLPLSNAGGSVTAEELQRSILAA